MTRSFTASQRIRRQRLAGLVLAVVSSGVCGCDEPRTRSYPDAGDICLEATADGEMTFIVSVTCLNYCEEHVLSCNATLEDGRVELETLLESTEMWSGRDSCPEACGSSTESCKLEAVPPGEYRFGFAGRVDTVTVPLNGRVPLFDGAECNPIGDSARPN